jgi:two-component system, OmpR family, phosphate regulon sensor histidine kinase PhoR
MKRHEGIWQGFAGMVVALSSIALATTIAYFVTSFVYQRAGLNPSGLPAQIVNSVLGVLLLVLVVGTASYFFRHRQLDARTSMFVPVIKALERIAKGDFSVQLETSPENRILGQLTESVNTMAAELNQMETLRQEFISNVSHELQSPLTSIRGFARALQDDSLSPADRQHYLNIIETESMRLSHLTENLLALASLESEHVKFDPKLYRLDRQIRNLILSCEPQWVEKGIELDVSLDEASIVADEDLLSEVWLNLIHNSIKFTPPAGKIAVALCKLESQIEFKITDTGPGISPDDQARIFERFFKADKARERAKGGSGLGLSIAQKIVDMHKGTIAVENQLGHGATFLVSLPIE